MLEIGKTHQDTPSLFDPFASVEHHEHHFFSATLWHEFRYFLLIVIDLQSPVRNSWLVCVCVCPMTIAIHPDPPKLGGS